MGGTDCGVDYDYGTTVVPTPTASPDSMFSAWTGCTSLSGQACTVQMTANRTLTLKFVAAHTLSVSASGNGSGKISTATRARPHVHEQLLRLADLPGQRHRDPDAGAGHRQQLPLGRWKLLGTAACTLAMTANRSALGQFTLNRHLLSIVNRATGNVITPSPFADGFAVDCGSGQTDCSDTLDYGTPVTLQATASTGYAFVNWAGVTCAGGATNSDLHVRAQGQHHRDAELPGPHRRDRRQARGGQRHGDVDRDQLRDRLLRGRVRRQAGHAAGDPGHRLALRGVR